MIQTEAPSNGLLFASFLYRKDLHHAQDLKTFWEGHFGEGFSFVPEKNPLAQYYSKEMGQELSRIFFMTTRSFPREFLLGTKLQSLNWESKWAVEGKRMVNVDIGFLTLENFILATTKNYSHRVFLGQNIFADLTYQFQDGAFAQLPWTYPDYRDQDKVDFFTWCRGYLLQNG